MIKNIKPPAEVLQWADRLLEMVGLSKVANNRATDMSGGQQQRIAEKTGRIVEIKDGRIGLDIKR